MELQMILLAYLFAVLKNVIYGSSVFFTGALNENVDVLIQWILSEEGQYIIEETGYVGVLD